LGTPWYAKYQLDDKLGTTKDLTGANKILGDLKEDYQKQLVGETKELTENGITATYEIKLNEKTNKYEFTPPKEKKE